MFRRFIALSLAVVLAAAPLTAYASEALGDDLDASRAEVNHRTELHSGTFWSNTYSDLREENYIVYAPSQRVTPVVTSGAHARQLTSVPNAAAQLEARGYRVVAGINGDYYDTANGLPLGCAMSEGKLVSVQNANYAIGFTADGTCVMGRPELTISAQTAPDSAFAVAAFNCVRSSAYGIYLYDSSFNDRHSTGTSEAGVDVVCRVEGGTLSIGGSLTLRVEKILPAATDTTIADGTYVLTANRNADPSFVNTLLALTPGQTLEIRVAAADKKWNDVENMLGALYQLVENGQVCGGLPTGAAPRTAVGLKADGSVILYTIDGRKSGYSIGASLTQTAARLIELGCTTAMSLDGGGSTTLVGTLPTTESAGILNRPSDGYARAVTNQLFLVASSERAGGVSHIYLDADNRFVLPGSTVRLTAAAMDEHYIPTSSAVSLSADRGSIRDGVFTAPETGGEVTVRAEGYGASASMTLTVVTAPDSISMARDGAPLTALTLSRKESAPLSVRAMYRHLGVAGDASSFTWSVSGDVGTIDENGVFTAADRIGSGSVTASFGGKSVTIPISVTAEPLYALAGYERPFADVTGSSAVLSRCTDRSFVRYGAASGKLSYSASVGESALLPMDFSVPGKYEKLNLWVYGDHSGAALTLTTDAGSAYLGTLDFSGYRPLSAVLPVGTTRLTGLAITSPTAVSGTIYLDQLVLAYGDVFDVTAPAILLTREERVVSGTVLDDCDGAALSLLRVTYDGAPLEHSFDKTGALRVSLPEADGNAHRVTICAGDASGNLSRTSLDLAASGLSPAFPDMTDHWANSHVAYLKTAGITTGDENGNFRPDAGISRQEFAVFLYRCLKPAQDFSAVELSFADAADIGPWAYESVRAMVALGVTNGTVNGMGESVFAPTSSISRQEAVTMIGRLFEKGYAAPELTFIDSGSVAPWAQEYVSVLSTMGILTGSDGMFRPNDSMTRAQVAAVLYKML